MVELVATKRCVTHIHLVVPIAILINAHSVDPGVVLILIPVGEDTLVKLIGRVVVPAGTDKQVPVIKRPVPVQRLHGLSHKGNVRDVLCTPEPTETNLLRLRRTGHKRVNALRVGDIGHDAHIRVERFYTLFEVRGGTEHMVDTFNALSELVRQVLGLVRLVHVVVRW